MRTVMYFFGMSRSGNHAVIDWIMDNALPPTEDRVAVHHNAVSSYHDVFKTTVLEGKRRGKKTAETAKPSQSPEDYAQAIRTRTDSGNALVLISYENERVEDIQGVVNEMPPGLVLPESRAVKLLLLRDPFNFMASRLQKMRTMEREGVSHALERWKWPNPAETMAMWKDYAREFLGDTNKAGNILRINYNEWFTDQAYRNSFIEQNFDGANQDLGIDHVAHYGRGSSFDGHSFDKRARKMNVLGRWKSFVADPEYRVLFQDPEVFDLSERIFGHISGTEVLRSASMVEGQSSTTSMDRR